MAFLPKPKVLVLDEPTTGLDVTTQGMVLQTMGELCRTHGVAALYVTHDLAVIANIADRVAVMYAGQIAELGARETIFAAPTHPYTRALLDSIPHLSQARALSGIPGRTPAPGARPSRLPVPRPLRVRLVECRSRTCPSSATSRPATRCAASGRARSATWDISRGTVPDSRPRQAARHHPQPRGPRHLLRPQAGRLRRHLRRRQGGGRGAGRRVRLRQDHDLALCRRPAQGVDRRDRVRGHPARPRLAQAAAPTDRKRIQYIFQNPYLVAEPAADDRADREAADGAVRHRVAARPPPRRWSSCSTRWRSARPS